MVYFKTIIVLHTFVLHLARIVVDPNIIQIVTWDESTPLTCLIPTLTGEGACTTALVDLLVGVHNEFIEKCHKELTKKE